jgi:hypothetical protein
MNYKRLAFETHPIHPPAGGNADKQETAASPARSSWMEEIDKRIVMKAGNTPPWKKEEQQPAPSGGKTFGSGLTADEVDRIVAKFVRDLS